MAGEIRREDVGIGFNIDYQKLEKLDTTIDKVVDKIATLGHKFEPINKQVTNFDRTFVDAIDKAIGANNRLADSNKEVSTTMQNNSRAATTFRDKIANINTVTDSYTSSQTRHYHEVGAALDQVNVHANKVGNTLRDLPKETTTKVAFDTNGVKTGAAEVKTQTRKVGGEMDKTAKKSRRLHDIIMGTFVGSAISNGVMALTNGLHEAAKAGMEYNKEQDTMKTVWKSLTTEAPKDGTGLVKYINNMSQHSIYAAGTLDKMAQSFYHVHSSEKETKNWTNDFVALGSTLHMTNGAMAESGEQFAKIVAGGKASAEDMSVMINRFPMFGEALQKSTGKSMKQLYAMSAAGKLTATQFTDALTYLGKKYKGGTKEAMTSFLGMSMYIKSRFSTLAGKVMDTSFKMSKESAKSMRNLLSDDMMQKYANGISSALGMVTGAAVKSIEYLDKHKKTILDIFGNIGDIAGIFGKEVWKTASNIIFDIGDAFGIVDKNGKSAKDPLDQLNSFLRGVDQHKEGIKLAAKAMVTFFAIKKASAFLGTIKQINQQLKISSGLDSLGSFKGILSPSKGKKTYNTKTSSPLKGIEWTLGKSGTKAGKNFSKEAVKGGKLAGKKGGTGFVSRMKSGAKKAGSIGGGMFSDAIDQISWAYLGGKLATHASTVFLKGVSTKKGAKAAWELGGDTVGGAIGYYLGGAPGAAAGAWIGENIVKTLASGDILKTKNKDSKHNAYKGVDPNKTPSLTSGGEPSWQSQSSEISNFGTGPKKDSSYGSLNPSGLTSKRKTSKSKIKIKTGFGHASGGPIRKTGIAMVNEAGKEVAYNSRKGTFRFLGNGPAITKVQAGEHILNAKDTSKLLHGGLGEGRVLPGFAKGTTSLKSVNVKSKASVAGVNDASLRNNEYKTKRSVNKITGDITKGYSKASKGATGKLKQLSRNSERSFKSIKSGTDKQTNAIRKNTIADFDTMQKKSGKQILQLKKYVSKEMDNIHDGMNKATKAMVSDFGDIMGKLQPLAKSAMKGAISSLNGGFSGIDSALSQFGGNKQVLKPIHYAKGSNGPIDSDQLAVLNDANNGPRQELVARGSQLLRPVGDNVAVHLQKGDEVFNGSQVERAKPYLPHFKKGTGASDSKLKSLASSNAGDPSKAFSQEFTVNVKANGSTLRKGLTGASKSGAKSVGSSWENAMWNYIESLISSDGGGGPVLHSPGAGWTKTSGFGNRGGVSGGFSSHDGNDFSGGKTVHALQDSVVTGAGGAPSGWGGSSGIGEHVDTKGGRLSLIYQELNGKSNSGAHILVHKGDHVKQGQPIAVLGPSGTHVHIGASTQGLWSHGGGSTRGWLDVTKLHGNYGNSGGKKSPKISKAMTSLVKSQLGSSAISWIKKNLQDSIGDADVGSLSGGMTSRAKTLAAAIKKMYGPATNAGIAAVLGNWEFESGLNPGAINPGGGASGLGQWLGGRKTALINYAKRHGKNWKNAGTQLEFALKGDGSDSSVLKSVLRGTGSVASLANKFSSQWERGGYNAQHVAGARKIEAALHNDGGWSKSGKLNVFGEKDREVAINPKKASADGLIQSAIKARASVDGSGLAGTLSRAMSNRPAAARIPQAKANGTSSRNVTIKMTNNITVQGGDGQNVDKQIISAMQTVIGKIRRAIGTDQGEGSMII